MALTLNLPKFVSGLKNEILKKSLKQGQVLFGTISNGKATLYADMTDPSTDQLTRFEVMPDLSNSSDFTDLTTRVSSLESEYEAISNATLLAIEGNSTSGGDSGNTGGNTDPDPGTDPNPGGGDNPTPVANDTNVLDDVEEATLTVDGNNVTISWLDPVDKYEGGNIIGQWAGTLILRKEGSAPVNHADGTVVTNSTEQDQYIDNGYVDSNLARGKTYYYRLFPYTTNGDYTASTTLTAEIPYLTVDVPTFTDTLTYTGSPITATLNGFDSSKMEVSGNTGTNAGNYTAIVSLTDSNYSWTNGSTSSQAVSWSIGKAYRSFTLSKEEVNIDYSTSSSDTVTVSNAIGTVSVTSDSNYVTVAYNDGTITVTNVNNETCVANVTVSDTGDGNRNGYSKTIIVHCAPIKISSWANGTKDEITAMVNAADNGEIDLADFWSVGDERSEVIFQEEVGTETVESNETLVIMHNGGYDLTTPISGGRSTVSFIVGIKDYFTYYSTYLSSGASFDSWTTWPNYAGGSSNGYGIFINTFSNNTNHNTNKIYLDSRGSSVDVSIFKKFNYSVPYHSTENSNMQTISTYVTAPAEKEVLGECVNSLQKEANLLFQFDYYKTVSNRIYIREYYDSSINENVTGPVTWMTRSIAAGKTNTFCGISKTGDAELYPIKISDNQYGTTPCYFKNIILCI